VPIHLLIDSTGLKVFGAGEWLQEKHGAKARRTWKKLHLAVDADTGMIMASTLTGNDVGDPLQVAPLLDQIEAKIASVTADGAYDGMPTYDVVAGHGEDVRVTIPPHVTAVLNAEAGHNLSRRDSTFFRLQLEEGWAGRRKLTTANALWLKPQWADTRRSSVFAYGRAASLVGRLKRLSAWPSSIECSTWAARTLSAVSTLLRNSAGKRKSSTFARSMQQRHCGAGQLH
jgi:hypothetical protein